MKSGRANGLLSRCGIGILHPAPHCGCELLRKGTANLEPARYSAPCLDRPSGLRDDVLDDRKTEAGPARRARSIRAVEALEEPGKLGLGDAHAVVLAREHHGAVRLPLEAEQEGRLRAC